MLVSPGPLLRFAATQPALRTAAPRLDVLDDLKYQLSNADPESRPARDLVENPVAAAYLVVLAIFGGGLAYLLYLDTQANAKREAALKEQREAAEMLRAQGLDDAAFALERDLKKERKEARAKKAAAEKPMGMGMGMPGMGMGGGGNAFAEDLDTGNRFERRQGPTARKKRKKGSKRK